MKNHAEAGFQDALAIATNKSAYIIPIHRYGANACSWIPDLFDHNTNDDADIIDFVRSTNGHAAFRRDKNGDGATLLAVAVKHNRHKLLISFSRSSSKILTMMRKG